MTYDPLGDLTKVAPVSGTSTSFTYNVEQGLTKATTDSNGAHTDYAYNALNLVSSRADQLGRAESFTYDPAGNLKKWVDRRGTVTKYCYDAGDNVSFIGYGYTGGGKPTCASSFTSNTTFTYDGGGRLQRVDDSRAGTITRNYDDLDRMTSETTPQGTISYTYDDANRRQSMTVTGQPQVAYAYFTNDQLHTITRGTNVVSLAYDAANRPDTTTLPNGVVEDWSLDPAGRMTGITYQKPGQSSLGALSYGYDAVGRRTTVWGASSGITLPTATSGTTVYDLANELKSWNRTALTYDANGNLASFGSQTYTFDDRNQLAATSGGTSSFRYDGLGRRYEKVVSGAVTRYLYDGPNVAQELDGTNAPTFNLLTGSAPDQVFWRQGQSGSSASTDSVLTDALGSTVATTTPDATPVIRSSFTYEPYGKPSATSFPYLFTGRDYDVGNGLQHNRARYYAPGFGRFVSEDQLGIAGGSPNSYVYGASSPTVFVDPTGLFWQGLGSRVATILELLANVTSWAVVAIPWLIAPELAFPIVTYALFGAAGGFVVAALLRAATGNEIAAEQDAFSAIVTGVGGAASYFGWQYFKAIGAALPKIEQWALRAATFLFSATKTYGSYCLGHQADSPYC